ncbi:MAG: hypothetical protein CL920_15175 [Deltaproteobacteria bacterium]|nr:hypothetical protein [Deltaproteobacteria bacterium]
MSLASLRWCLLPAFLCLPLLTHCDPPQFDPTGYTCTSVNDCLPSYTCEKQRCVVVVSQESASESNGEGGREQVRETFQDAGESNPEPGREQVSETPGNGNE